jgi:Tol biopolymer transport system component
MVSRSLLTAAGVVAAIALGVPPPAAAQTTTRVSLASTGIETHGHNYWGSVSGNGRWLVFSSDAKNVVPGDTNGKTDVFWRDTVTGEVRRVSVNDAGVQGDGRSFASGVSKDGRLVLFWSHAANLVPGDTNVEADVFLHDVVARTTTRLSFGLDGTQPNAWCQFPSMSEDGRYVAFQSVATNLVPGDVDEFMDIFLLDRRTNVLTRVTQAPNESSRYPVLSPNGRWLGFESDASNLVTGDTNGEEDAFVWDRVRGTLVRASVDDDEVQGNGSSGAPIVSNDGRWATFYSTATNLVPGDTNATSDSFVRDLRRGTTRRVSVDSNGVQGNSSSNRGVMDASGRWVVFASHASNLVAGDVNGAFDVFVHDLRRGTTVRASAAHDGGEPNANVFALGFANSRTLFASSSASNLVPGDANLSDDLFFIRWR